MYAQAIGAVRLLLFATSASALAAWSMAPAAQQASFDGRLLRARILIQLDRGAETLSELSTLRAETSAVEGVETWCS